MLVQSKYQIHYKRFGPQHLSTGSESSTCSNSKGHQFGRCIAERQTKTPEKTKINERKTEKTTPFLPASEYDTGQRVMVNLIRFQVKTNGFKCIIIMPLLLKVQE